MMLKLTKPEPSFRTATGSGNSKAVAACSPEYRTYSTLNQELIDPIMLIAARSGVSVATVRAHCLAYGIGGCR